MKNRFNFKFASQLFIAVSLISPLAIAQQGDPCVQAYESKEIAALYTQYHSKVPRSVLEDKSEIAEMAADILDIRGPGYASVLNGLAILLQQTFVTERESQEFMVRLKTDRTGKNVRDLESATQADIEGLSQKIALLNRIYTRFLSTEGGPSYPGTIFGAPVLRGQSVRMENDNVVFQRISRGHILTITIPAKQIFSWVRTGRGEDLPPISPSELIPFESRTKRDQVRTALPTSEQLLKKVQYPFKYRVESLMEFAFNRGMVPHSCLIDISDYRLKPR